MRTFTASLLSSFVLLSVMAQPVIDTFSAQGILEVSNTSPGKKYTLQWRNSLEADENWKSDWSQLTEALAESDQMSFQVPMFFRIAEDIDVTPPGNVADVSADVGDQLVDVKWSNPSDSDLAEVILVRATDTPADHPDNGAVVYQGLGTSFTDLDVENGVEYFYSVFAKDLAGNLSGHSLVAANVQRPLRVVTVRETFGNAVGDNGLVRAHGTTAAHDPARSRFNSSRLYTTGSFSVSGSSTQVVWTHNTNGFLEDVQFELKGSNSGGTLYSIYAFVRFVYTDGTTSDSSWFTSYNIWRSFSVTNPAFSKKVEKVELHAHSLQGTGTVRNFNTSPVYQPVVLEIQIPQSPGNILQTRISISAVRETGDDIHYELSDGVSTRAFDSFDTWYDVDETLTNPTFIRIHMIPKEPPTPLETGVISVDFDMRKR